MGAQARQLGHPLGQGGGAPENGMDGRVATEVESRFGPKLTRISQCIVPRMDVPHVPCAPVPLCPAYVVVQLLRHVVNIPFFVFVPILSVRHVGHPPGVDVADRQRLLSSYRNRHVKRHDVVFTST